MRRAQSARATDGATMVYIKWFFYAVIITLVVSFLHYSLPSRDVVQVVGTEVVRMDIGQNAWFWASQDAGTTPSATRDVRFINAKFPDGSPRVYRNEDTGWGWPALSENSTVQILIPSQRISRNRQRTGGLPFHIMAGDLNGCRCSRMPTRFAKLMDRMPR